MRDDGIATVSAEATVRRLRAARPLTAATVQGRLYTARIQTLDTHSNSPIEDYREELEMKICISS